MAIRQRLTWPHLFHNSIFGTSSGFSNQNLNFNSQHFFLRPVEIFHAAITVGKPSTLEFENTLGNDFGLADAISRIYMLKAQVNFGNCCDHLKYSSLFNQSDPTEKAQINYHLGMIFTKVFADRILQIPWLAHYSWMSNSGDAQVHSGRSTPDLLGFSIHTGRWNSFEAKGRNSKYNPDVIENAKIQASRWVKVLGSSCDLKIGAGLFRGKDGAFEFYWDDPAGDLGEEPIFLEPNPRVWRNYYRAALALAEIDTPISGIRVKLSPILRDYIYQMMDNMEWPRTEKVLLEIFKDSLARRESIKSDSNVFVGLDGIDIIANE